jgi:hypothetical protein
MNTTLNAPERQEIEELLPWHAAGTLSPRDAQRVEDALKRDPALARSYELVREEFSETILLNENLGAPSARAASKLFAAIDAEAGPVRAQARQRFSFTERVGSWLESFSPRTLAYAATAGALAIALQFGVLTSMYVGGRTGASYTTASRPTTDLGAGTFALVSFAPEASAGAITEYLKERNLVIVDGPRANGFYRVRLASTALPRSEADQFVRQLPGDGSVIRFALPSE